MVEPGPSKPTRKQRIAAELATARELLPLSHLAAGALAGVALERHVNGLVKTHAAPLSRNARRTFSRTVRACAALGVISDVESQEIRRLYDIRRYCVHAFRDPKPEKIHGLIEGVAALVEVACYD